MRVGRDGAEEWVSVRLAHREVRATPEFGPGLSSRRFNPSSFQQFNPPVRVTQPFAQSTKFPDPVNPCRDFPPFALSGMGVVVHKLEEP